MSDTDSDDHNQEEPPPGFSRNANDATDIKRLRTMDVQQLQDNYNDLSSFFNYYGNLFISVETDEEAYDVMYTHPILLPVLKQFQIQEAYNNNSDYDNSESEDNYQTCVRCNHTFPCPVTYQGNQPICTTCSAELRHQQTSTQRFKQEQQQQFNTEQRSRQPLSTQTVTDRTVPTVTNTCSTLLQANTGSTCTS